MNYRVQIRNWATLAAADVLMFVLNLGLLIASLVTGKTTATLVSLLAVFVSIWATAVAVRVLVACILLQKQSYDAPHSDDGYMPY